MERSHLGGNHAHGPCTRYRFDGNTPIDYLDFASPISGLGGKMGLDATNKWPGETNREWGRVIKKDPAVTAKIDEIWERLGL